MVGPPRSTHQLLRDSHCPLKWPAQDSLGPARMILTMKAKSPRPPPAPQKWVRPWLTAHCDAIRQLVAETLEAAEWVRGRAFPEDPSPTPLRSRQSHDALVRALVVNLAHASLSRPPSGRLAIRAGNAPKAKTRYDHPAFGKGVKPLLTVMHEAGLLDFPFASRDARRSVVHRAEEGESNWSRMGASRLGGCRLEADDGERGARQ
jgi:hypothetical protein